MEIRFLSPPTEYERDGFLPKWIHREAAWRMTMTEMGKERKRPGKGREENKTAPEWERKDGAGCQGRAAWNSLSTLNTQNPGSVTLLFVA